MEKHNVQEHLDIIGTVEHSRGTVEYSHGRQNDQEHLDGMELHNFMQLHNIIIGGQNAPEYLEIITLQNILIKE